MSVAGRIIKNTGWLYAKMGITMFISLWITRLILNALGHSDFGIFNVVGGAISMLGFLNVAMASATQRFMSYSQGQGNIEGQITVFNVSFSIHLSISFIVALLLVAAGAILFAFVFDIPADRMSAAKIVYGSLIISTFFSIITVPYDALLNAHENMKYYAIVGVFESVLKLSVAFVCVWTNADKLVVYGILMACIPLASLLIVRTYCRRHYKECVVAPRKYFSLSKFKEMISFAGWNLLGTLTTMFAFYGIGIVLNSFFGTIVNAAHGIANQLSGQVLAFSNNLIKAINPVISKTEGAGERQQMLSITLAGCKFSYVMIALFSIPLFIEMPYVLKLWLKTVPDYTVVFARIVIVKSSIEQLTTLLNTSISAEGRVKEMHILNSIASVVFLVLGIIILSKGSEPYTIYLLYLLFFAVLVPIGKMSIMKRNCGMTYSSFISGVFLPMVIVTAVSFVVGYFVMNLMDESFVRLVVVSAACGLSFVFSVFIFALNRAEKTMLYDVIRRKAK